MCYLSLSYDGVLSIAKYIGDKGVKWGFIFDDVILITISSQKSMQYILQDMTKPDASI